MTRKRSRRTDKGTNPSSRPKATTLLVVGVVLALVATGAYLTLGDDDPSPGTSVEDCTLTPVSTFAHIHGLAVDPTSPNVLYAATHHGLFRAVDDADWARVGSVQDDLMGFTVHPTNGSIMWSSGHPTSGGNMGVRGSSDGGCTWTTLSTGPGENKVDFHTMVVSPADPSNLWGYHAGKLYRTTDGGHEWATVSPNAPRIYGLAPHPSDEDTIYAATRQGILHSTDAGASWEPVTSEPTATLAIARTDASTMFASTQQGVFKSTDAGATWQPLPLDAGAVVTHIALHPNGTDTAYVATTQSAIHMTSDGGATWTEVKPASR